MKTIKAILATIALVGILAIGIAVISTVNYMNELASPKPIELPVNAANNAMQQRYGTNWPNAIYSTNATARKQMVSDYYSMVANARNSTNVSLATNKP